MLGLFRSTPSVTKLINTKLASNKPLKKEYKDFEKKSQSLDINALQKIGVMMKVDRELSTKETSRFLNSQLVSVILAMATVHPYGRIAYTSFAALSVATEIIPTIKQQTEIKNLKSIFKAFNDFEEWPNIYDFKKMRYLDVLDVSEEVDMLCLGLPSMITNLLKDKMYNSDEATVSDFLYYVERGNSEREIENLIVNVTDEDAIEMYEHVISTMKTYRRIDELRFDLSVVEEHLDKYPDLDDVYNIRLYKVIYDMLYREVYRDELYSYYVEAYAKITGDSSSIDDYSFYKVALKEGYKEFIMLAPITSYDLHVLSNRTDSGETTCLVLKSVISRSHSLDMLTDKNKSDIIDEYERIIDSETKDPVLKRLRNELINIYNRLNANGGEI